MPALDTHANKLTTTERITDEVENGLRKMLDGQEASMIFFQDMELSRRSASVVELTMDGRVFTVSVRERK